MSRKRAALGGDFLKPQEGWIFSPCMAGKCPGLPSYEALYDCAQAFAAADTFPKGRPSPIRRTGAPAPRTWWR